MCIWTIAGCDFPFTHSIRIVRRTEEYCLWTRANQCAVPLSTCIKINDSCMSDFFECNQGVRQGESLAIVIAIFLNAMKDFVR